LCVQVSPGTGGSIAAAIVILAISLGSAAAQDRGTELLSRDGISIAVPRGGAIHDATDVGGRETYLRYRDGRLRLRLIRGGDYSADPVGHPSSATTICGRPARRFEISIPRTEAHSCSGGRGREVMITPASVLVIVTLALDDGTRLRIDWEALTEHRARLRLRERAFFRSIRCDRSSAQRRRPRRGRRARR